jgi:hypothetical protein
MKVLAWKTWLSDLTKFGHRKGATHVALFLFSSHDQLDLGIYLVLSFILQLSSQWRDAKLDFDESKTWLDVLQHYSSQADKRDRFLEPIGKRRQTLLVAMWITYAIYGVLALATWNLPFIVELLLAQ